MLSGRLMGGLVIQVSKGGVGLASGGKVREVNLPGHGSMEEEEEEEEGMMEEEVEEEVEVEAEGVLIMIMDLGDGMLLLPLVLGWSPFEDADPATATASASVATGGGRRSFPDSSKCSLHLFTKFSSPICSTLSIAATATEGSRRALICS